MSIEQPPASTSKELREYLVRQIDRIGRIADYIIGGLAMLALKKLVIVGANSTTTGDGQLYLNGLSGNRIDFNSVGIGNPTFTTRSVGTKICLYPLLDASNTDYALGVNTNVFWSSVPTSSRSFKWFGGTSLAATLTGTGYLSLTGKLGVETTAVTANAITLGDITGGIIARGVHMPSIVQSDVTTACTGYSTILGTEAAAFTCQSVYHFIATQGTIGAGSTVTNQIGFLAQNSLTGATNNYGFYGNIASGTGQYNFYAGGTADNYFNGKITCTNAINSSSSTGGIGYTTGAGGTVTQTASKATGVTLSKMCGTITTHSASLAANTAVSFVLTNTVLAATDNMILNIVGGTNGAYCLGLDAVAAGSCTITLRNLTAGAIAEAVTIRFTILNSVNA